MPETFRILAIDKKMPMTQSKEKVSIAACMLKRNWGCVSTVTACPAMTIEKMMVIIVMLVIIPRVRMVLLSPEATPRWRGATLPMITLTFGEEKRAKPRPRIASMTTILVTGVVVVIEAAMPRPVAQRAMPMVATLAAEKRSESRPHSGEKTACTTG